MANKNYSMVVNGVEVFVDKKVVYGRPEFETKVGNKTFTVQDFEPSSMIIKAIIAPYAVFIGEGSNIELAVGFTDKDMAVCWMNQLPEEDAKKAYCITTASYLGGNYRYL